MAQNSGHITQHVRRLFSILAFVSQPCFSFKAALNGFKWILQFLRTVAQNFKKEKLLPLLCSFFLLKKVKPDGFHQFVKEAKMLGEKHSGKIAYR